MLPSFDQNPSDAKFVWDSTNITLATFIEQPCTSKYEAKDSSSSITFMLMKKIKLVFISEECEVRCVCTVFRNQSTMSLISVFKMSSLLSLRPC